MPSVVADDVGGSVSADPGNSQSAKKVCGRILVVLVMLWTEYKGGEMGSKVYEALDDIAACWSRHHYSRRKKNRGDNTNCVYELFEALRSHVYADIIVPLLNKDRPDILSEFLQDLLRGEVSRDTLLKSLLPDILPVLFLNRCTSELLVLAKLREADEGGAADPKPPDTEVPCAGYTPSEHASVTRMVRPKLHFIIVALLKSSGVIPHDELLKCWTLVLTLFRGTPTQLLLQCWWDLLGLLAIELGGYSVRRSWVCAVVAVATCLTSTLLALAATRSQESRVRRVGHCGEAHDGNTAPPCRRRLRPKFYVCLSPQVETSTAVPIWNTGCFAAGRPCLACGGAVPTNELAGRR